MSDTSITREEVQEILYSIDSLSFVEGTTVINCILRLQEEKRNPSPAVTYARLVSEGEQKAHEWLVDFALTNPEIVQFAANGKKIQAIKEIRTYTNAYLLQAKNAFEEAYPYTITNL